MLKTDRLRVLYSELAALEIGSFRYTNSAEFHSSREQFDFISSLFSGKLSCVGMGDRVAYVLSSDEYYDLLHKLEGLILSDDK